MVYQFIHERRISALDQSTPRGKPMNLTCVLVRAVYFPAVLSGSTAAINVARCGACQGFDCVQERYKAIFPIYILYRTTTSLEEGDHGTKLCTV